MASAISLLKNVNLSPQGWAAHGINVNKDGSWRTAFHMLRYPNITSTDLLQAVPDLSSIPPHILARIDIEGTYCPHLSRQEADVKVFMEDESLLLDPGMEYSNVPGLSSEVMEKLYRVRPSTIVSGLRSWCYEVVCADDVVGRCEEDRGYDAYFCCVSVEVRKEDVAEIGCRGEHVGRIGLSMLPGS